MHRSRHEAGQRSSSERFCPDCNGERLLFAPGLSGRAVLHHQDVAQRRPSIKGLIICLMEGIEVPI